MNNNKLKSAEVFGVALHTGQAIVECDTLKEAISTRTALYNWAAYNGRTDKYEIVREKLTITVTLRTAENNNLLVAPEKE